MRISVNLQNYSNNSSTRCRVKQKKSGNLARFVCTDEKRCEPPVINWIGIRSYKVHIEKRGCKKSKLVLHKFKHISCVLNKVQSFIVQAQTILNTYPACPWPLMKTHMC